MQTGGSSGRTPTGLVVRATQQVQAASDDVPAGGADVRRSSPSWWTISIVLALLLAAAVAVVVALTPKQISTTSGRLGNPVIVSESEADQHISAKLTVESLAVAADTRLCTVTSPSQPAHGYWVVADVDVTNMGPDTLSFIRGGGFDLEDDHGKPLDWIDGLPSGDCVPFTTPNTSALFTLNPGQSGRMTLAFDVSSRVGTITFAGGSLAPHVQWSYPAS